MGLNAKAVGACFERVFTTKNGAKWVREVAKDGARTYTNVATNKAIKFGGSTGGRYYFGKRRIYDPGITGYSISSNGYTSYYCMSNYGKRISKSIRKDGQSEFIQEYMFGLDPHGKRVFDFTTVLNGNMKRGGLGRRFWETCPSRIYEEVGGVGRLSQGPDEAPLWTGLQDALKTPFYKPS